MTHDPDQDATPFEVVASPGQNTALVEYPTLRERWQRQSVRGRALTAAAAVAVLTLGGTVVAYAATSAGSDSDAAPAASSGSASSAPQERGPGPDWWFGADHDGVHGESTVKDSDSGDWVVEVWQRGTVEKIDGDQVTVKSEDGAEWTWTVGSDTAVQRDGDDGSGADDLKQDETVYVTGTRSDDTRTADRVLAGTWDRPDWGGGPGRMPGRGDHHEEPEPSASPSSSGATT